MSLITILFQILIPAFAADYYSPRAAGLGGAGRAGALLTDAIYLNPANASFLAGYAGSYSFRSYQGPQDSEPKGKVRHFSLLDGRNELAQAGLGYTRGTDRSYFHVSSSRRIAQNLGFGIGYKFGHRSNQLGTYRDASVGLQYNVLRNVQLSFTGDNLFEPAVHADWKQYREFHLGSRISLVDILLVYFDPGMIRGLYNNKLSYAAGLELKLSSDLFLRVGKNLRTKQTQLQEYGNGYGFGFGWIAPRFSLDFAVYRSQIPQTTRDWLISGTASF